MDDKLDKCYKILEYSALPNYIDDSEEYYKSMDNFIENCVIKIIKSDNITIDDLESIRYSINDEMNKFINHLIQNITKQTQNKNTKISYAKNILGNINRIITHKINEIKKYIKDDRILNQEEVEISRQLKECYNILRTSALKYYRSQDSEKYREFMENFNNCVKEIIKNDITINNLEYIRESINNEMYLFINELLKINNVNDTTENSYNISFANTVLGNINKNITLIQI